MKLAPDLPVDGNTAIHLIEQAMGMRLDEMQLADMDEAEAFARLGTAYIQKHLEAEALRRRIAELDVPF